MGLGRTPGPWRRGIGNQAHTVFDEQGRIVADCCGYQDGNLIAVAPDMEEAIEQALDDMGNDGHSVCEQTKQMLRDALKSVR